MGMELTEMTDLLLDPNTKVGTVVYKEQIIGGMDYGCAWQWNGTSWDRVKGMWELELDRRARDRRARKLCGCRTCKQ